MNLEELMQCVGTNCQLREQARMYHDRCERFSNLCTKPVVSINAPHVEIQPHCSGRPVLCINVDQVEMLRQVGYSWQEVADAVGVSRTTLWGRLREQNVTLSPYTDDELDELVKSIQRDFPNAGLVMVQGYLQSRGVQVQRYRVRQSVAQNYPIR